MAKPKKSEKPPVSRKRWGVSRLFGLMVVVALCGVGSGVMTFQWSDGNPQLSIDPAQIPKIGNYLQELIASASDKTGKPATGSQTQPGNGSLPEQNGGLVAQSGGGVAATATVSLPPIQSSGADSIKIATFNIQVFGTSKLQKTKSMQVLTSVVRNFDVVAIQEVRSTDDNVVPTFVKMINAEGARYDFVIGPRLGRTNSKEQYAILFDTARIEVDRSSVYTTPDPQDLLHREPMAARFRVRGVPPNQAFTFTLVDIHTDPDETKGELNALANTFVGVQQNGSGEDDVILLGDLNVDENHLGNLGRLPEIGHAISKVTTNTRHTQMYDNIVFSRPATTEYTGRSGVLDLMSQFGLTQAEALEVSDHCPAWAEFSVYESGNSQPVAGVPRVTPR
jgi:endonuclease/exonuclease/phosphatase family metal-dependent hydrolase